MNPSTALASVCVDELLRGGVADAVLAPGSRSTPLALALHEADAAGRLRLHVRTDERSAAFLALGLAKASQSPVPVLTTSGTAAANLLPATLEADASGIPLLLVTADRPPELRATGANQTVDQVKIFGGAVRAYVELGPPEERVGQTGYWRSLIARALADARGTLTRDPGPVHLNVALRDPLVPDEDRTWPEPLGGRQDGGPWTRVDAAVTVAPNVHLPSRTLVLVGDVEPSLGRAALRLAQERGWPLISEPSGNARSGANVITTGPWLLDAPEFVTSALPDLVLVVGRPTLSRSVLALLRDPRVDVDVVAGGARWPDPTRTAGRVLPALPAPDGHHDPDVEWLDQWVSAEAAARAAVDEVVAEHHTSEARLARDLFAAIPSDALLYLGSSMPVRDVFVTAGARDGVTVLANRGVAGIDGTVSSAIGAALAWQRAGGGRAFALVGDLTFLHDSNGLVMGPDDARPDLTFVVVNNDGGAIFSLLEPGGPAHEVAFERVFGTPHGVDLAALCAATATPFTRADSIRDALTTALDPRIGLQVVEVRTDRSAVPKVQEALRSAVHAALVVAPD
jgi:2-succinyl-5-enolpyruvyl-6-hydroxy-3-cyclohexene-1-carboxylate synthase